MKANEISDIFNLTTGFKLDGDDGHFICTSRNVTVSLVAVLERFYYDRRRRLQTGTEFAGIVCMHVFGNKIT